MLSYLSIPTGQVFNVKTTIQPMKPLLAGFSYSGFNTQEDQCLVQDFGELQRGKECQRTFQSSMTQCDKT